MDDLFVVIGLGNPGKRYENTRHNVGFDTVDLLAEQLKIKVGKLKHQALIGEGGMEGYRIVLAKPQTFMNSSGESVGDIVDWYKTDFNNVIIIYDDADLPLGKIRVRQKGSSGTHNGLKSIIYHIQTDVFPRIKIGIGSPPEGWELTDYVLGRFDGEDRKIIDRSMAYAVEAAIAIVKYGIDHAMNKYN